MRSSSPRRSGRSLLWAVFLAIVIALPIQAYMNLPRHVRVLPEQPYALPGGLLFHAVDPERSGSGLAAFFQARAFAGSVSLTDPDEPTLQLQWRLLGLLPVGTLTIERVPEVAVVPGGQSIGVLLNGEGLIVTRTVPVTGERGERFYPAEEAGIFPGDLIVEVQGQRPHSPQHIARIVQSAGRQGDRVRLVVERNGRRRTTEIEPIAVLDRPGVAARYMLGLYLQDPVAGVGTLSFYHPASRRYGALGHEVTAGGREPVEISNGRIVPATIRGIHRGMRGRPGEKIGAFDHRAARLGTIEKNSRYGIFGRLEGPLPPSPFDRPVPVAMSHEVTTGPATMLTVLNGDAVEAFDVEILRVFPRGNEDGRGMVLRIVDPRLLARTEGIVQGMSGSPILQNGRLVGAVSHVFVNDPARGYGTMAEWMVYEAGIISLPPASAAPVQPLPHEAAASKPDAA